MNDDLLVQGAIRDEIARTADAMHPPTELLDAILATSGRRRPRSRWLAILLQPAMRTEQRVLVGTPRRTLLIAGLLALLALGLVGAVAGALLLRPMPAPGVTSEDWPMYRGDASRGGHATTGPVGLGVVAWRARASAPVVTNLSIVGDAVYASSDDGIVRALAFADGRERWRARVSDRAPVSLAFDESTLFTADVDGIVHALDPTTGTERWRTTQRIDGPTELTTGAGLIYSGTTTGSVVAFDAGAGALAWATTVSRTGGAINAPAFADGGIYVSTARDGIVRLDAATGTISWQLGTGTDELGPAVVAEGIVYAGTLSESSDGRLRAIDAATGVVRWQDDERFQAPSISDGVAYGVADRILVALDAQTGIEHWRVQLAGEPGPFAVARDAIYLATNEDGRLHAFDRPSGGELWSIAIDGIVRCCVGVARGRVFLGTDTNSIYAIGGDGSRVTPAKPEPIASPSPAATPAPLPSIDPGPVTHLWTAAFEDPASLPTNLEIAPDGTLWGCDPANHRFGLFTSNGEFLEYWGEAGTGPGQLILTRVNGEGYGGIAFARDGRFFVLDAGNYRVQAFGPDRELLWRSPGYGVRLGEFSGPAGIDIGPDGLVYVLDEIRGVIEVFDPDDGSVVHTVYAYPTAIPGFNSSAGLAVGPDGHIFVGYDKPQKVTELDSSGTPIREFGARAPSEIVNASGYLAVGPNGRLYLDQEPGRGNAPPVLSYEADSTFITGIVGNGEGDGQVIWPTGLAFDANGDLYVADVGQVLTGNGRGRIQKFHLKPPLSP